MDSTVEDQQYTYFSDLYLTSKYLVVIGQRYTYFTLNLDGEFSNQTSSTKSDMRWYWYGFAQSVIMIYDLETLNKVETFEVHGNILTSRLIENNLYLISTQYVVIDDQMDPRPIFKQGNTPIIPEYNQIKFLPNTSLDAYTIITRIDLSSTPTMEFDIFLGTSSWGQLYVSLNAIYFATNTYTFNRVTSDYVTVGTLISYMFNADGSVSFGGSTEFEGYVINQFAMDEYEGNIRIVTTDGWGDFVKNRLYIFEKAIVDNKRILRQVALIDEGLGKPRERVQSVRFNGPLATVVTFEMTDPFYTIDLSNPKNPIIRAGLEVTGFSTYQHPWLNQTVIGIGYEADDNGRILGIKLSLYDVSDWDNPVEIGKSLVLYNGENGWNYSEALHNHKAILINEERGFIGFAMQRSYWTVNSYEYASEYMIFSIDPNREQPIAIDASLGHMDLYLANRNHYQNNQRYSYDFSVERAVYIGDYLYVISGEAISSHNMNRSYERVSIIPFLK
jgi:inhibitor of cysteine peptidase